MGVTVVPCDAIVRYATLGPGVVGARTGAAVIPGNDNQDIYATARPPRATGPVLWLCVGGMATISFNTTRVAGWTLSDLLFLCAGGLIALQILTGQTARLPPAHLRKTPSMIVVGMLLLLGGGTLSAIGSWDPVPSMLVVARLAWVGFVWFWIIRCVSTSPDVVKKLLSGWRVTVLVSAGAASLGQQGIAFVSEFDSDRQAAFNSHPGELMQFLVPAVPWFVLLAMQPTHGTFRRLRTAARIGALVLLVTGILATGSFGGALFGSAASLITVAVLSSVSRPRTRSRPRTPLRGMAILVAAMIGLVVLATSDTPAVNRFTAFMSGDSYISNSVSSRNERNAVVLDDIPSYLVLGTGPIFGGEEGGQQGEVQVENIHNMYVKVAYEYGFIALVGLWMVLLHIARQIFRLVILTKGTDLHLISLALAGAFVAANVNAMFGPVIYARHFWTPAALIGALTVALYNAASTPPSVPPTATSASPGES